MSGRKRVNIRISDQFHDWLSGAATDLDMPMSSLATMALECGLLAIHSERTGQPHLRDDARAVARAATRNQRILDHPLAM